MASENATSESREPDELDSIRQIIDAEMAELHVAMPGWVEKFDGTKTDVKPALSRTYLTEDEDEETVEPPIITNVPVAFPRGGGAFISLPLKPGDPVWLLFSERSLDAYLESDGKSDIDPEDARRSHLSDAICLPAGGTFRNAIPNVHADDLVIGLENGNTEIHITPSGEVWVKAGVVRLGENGAAKALALAETVNARLQALETVVTLPHVSQPFGGLTTPPGFSPGGGDVSSDKVFASS